MLGPDCSRTVKPRSEQRATELMHDRDLQAAFGKIDRQFSRQHLGSPVFKYFERFRIRVFNQKQKLGGPDTTPIAPALFR